MLDEILQLLARAQSAPYIGEPVSQLEHALQCAALASAGGADRALVVKPKCASSKPCAAKDMLRLRAWDELAKEPGKVVPELARYEPLLRAELSGAK